MISGLEGEVEEHRNHERKWERSECRAKKGSGSRKKMQIQMQMADSQESCKDKELSSSFQGCSGPRCQVAPAQRRVSRWNSQPRDKEDHRPHGRNWQ